MKFHKINKFEGLMPKVNRRFDTIGEEMPVIDIDALVNEHEPKQNAYDKKEDVAEYLYYFEYSNLDYKKQMKEFHNNFYPKMACSSVHNGNFYGRNLDLYYNNDMEMVVRTTSADGDDYLSGHRFATIGVSCGLDEFTREFLEKNAYSKNYEILPFEIVDGINEKGVVCNINVVPVGDRGNTTASIPAIEAKMDLCSLMIVRFVLDNFETAKEAAEYIGNYVSIYNPKLANLEYEYHFMIGDKNDTYIVEIIDNHNVVTKANERPWMVNYHYAGTIFDENNKVDYLTSNLSPHASGLERSNLIADNFANASTFDGMKDLMCNKLKYTNAYTRDTNPLWYTEFCADLTDTELGIDLTLEAIVNPETKPLVEAYVDYAIGKFNERGERRPKHGVWETTHTSVYDIQNKTLHLWVKEQNDTEFTYTL